MFRIICLLSGRGSNFQAILDNIQNHKLKAEIACVIADRQCTGLEIAKENNIKAFLLEPKSLSRKDYASLLLEKIKIYSPDLIVLAGFMRILDESFVHALEGKILNIHPSLLPLFKGLRPQKQAIEKGVKISGATVHFVTEVLDSGPIIIQAAVAVHPADTEGTLANRILQVEHKIYSMAIKLIIDGKVTFVKTVTETKAEFKNISYNENYIISPYLVEVLDGI